MTIATESAPVPAPPSGSVPLRGGWRIVGRIASLVTAGGAVALVVAAIPAQLAASHIVCVDAPSCVSGQLTLQAATTLHQYGITLSSYAIFSTAVFVVSALVWFAAGALLLLRRTADRMALLVGLQAFTQGANNASNYISDPHNTWFFLAVAMSVFSNILLFYVFALFPSGRFVPSWMRWAAIMWILLQPIEFLPGLNGLSFPFFFIALLLLVGCQIYRYHRVSGPIQRQQAKLVVAALAAIVVTNIGLTLPVAFIPSLGGSNDLYASAGSNVTTLILLLGPVSLVAAVFRYRLFDIDVLINRTLVYGSLTAVLAAVYFACVVGTQAVVQALTGQTDTPPVVIVASTLLIAGLFMPLRRRLQSFIDRRFYRAKYDAAKTLATFGATLRTETNLDGLTRQLVGVVEVTMQPEHVTLWLRTSDKHETETRQMTQRGGGQ